MEVDERVDLIKEVLNAFIAYKRLSSAQLLILFGQDERTLGGIIAKLVDSDLIVLDERVPSVWKLRSKVTIN